ncbi:MAG: hypothetical protein GX890_00310 [Firmicutes bacterium]|jgi:hypothetical protein|nr:hypothetical protein [Bacillota bacterium]
MALFIGQLLITGALLSGVAAPLLREKFPFLRELVVGIDGDVVTAEIAGRYGLIGFKGLVKMQMLEFVFAPSRYRIVLRLSAELRPFFLGPLLLGRLRKTLSRRPDVSWSGGLLTLELAKMPLFARLKKSSAWEEFFSRLEIAPGRDSRGLLFNLFLHEPHRGEGSPDAERGS